MSTAVIDGGREILYRAEAKRAVADQLNLVVHAFQSAIGKSQAGPGQDAIEMSAEQANEFFERLESGAHGRMHPAAQMLLGPSWLAVAPKELKGLFEVVGTHDRCVPAYQSREALALVGPQVPGILQQQETGPLEEGPFLSAQAA